MNIFESKWTPEPNTGCFLWHAARDKDGYGVFQSDQHKYNVRAHRFSWEQANKRSAKDFVVRHSCDTPECVNPDHLLIGTHADNTHDAIMRNRLSTGDQHYSRTQPELLAWGDRNGARLHPEKLARGENHGCVKLTAQQVREIRLLIEAKQITKTEIGRRFSVSRATISHIAHGRLWKDLV